MSASNSNPGDFDERLQFLLQSSESLHANLQELHANLQGLREHVKDVEDRFNARTDRILTATENLLAIARSHQERLDKLDGGTKQ